MKKEKKRTQPVFLDDSQMETLGDFAKEIIKSRNLSRTAVKSVISIDLLDTDKIKTVVSAGVIKQYDPDYRVNMRRNGIDGASGEDRIEVKNSVIENATRRRMSGPNEGKCRDAGWQFHAFHNEDYDRLILIVWDKESLEVVRIYDIKHIENIEKIKTHLDKETETFNEKVKQMGKKATRDVIVLPEQLVAQSQNLSTSIVEGVTVIKDW